MIIKGGSRKNRFFFARHLLNAKDNDQVRVVGFRGFANEDVGAAFQDMAVMARGTRCANFFYAVSLSPDEQERLSEAQWERAVDTLELRLGLQDQPRFVIEHEKKGRVHRHVVWSRIDADTLTARPDSLTYQKHEQAARDIERDCGLAPVASVLVKDREGPRPARRARDWEGMRGSQSGLTPDQVKAEVSEIWRETDSGQAFRTALAQRGYALCRGDRRDYVIVDRAGHEHSLARRIEGAKTADIRKRLNDLDREALPVVVSGRKERRDDQRKVGAAVAQGADKKRMEAAINASRASTVSPHSHDGGAMPEDGREAYERTVKYRRNERTRSWQERHTQRREDVELER